MEKCHLYWQRGGVDLKTDTNTAKTAKTATVCYNKL